MKTQPKPESWKEIAREAAKDLFGITYENRNKWATRIILAAIERSHAKQARTCDQCSRKLEDGALYEDHAAQPQVSEKCTCMADSYCKVHGGAKSQHSDPPPAKATDDRPQEWTVESGQLYDVLVIGYRRIPCEKRLAKTVAAAHNAELAAERQRREQERSGKLLYMGREKVVRSQLLSALAAIEKHNEEQRHNMLPYFVDDELDLSLLHEHDAEVRKPLVDALNAIVKARDFGHAYDIAQDALAKEKP